MLRLLFALLPLCSMLLLGSAMAFPEAGAGIGEGPVAREFHRAATEQRLVRRGEAGLLAGLADTARANADATIWTISLTDGGTALSAHEAAERLGRARRDPMKRLLFRHVLGWSGREAPAGILPLGPGSLRFLLDRPDPAFPARLAEIEASLCDETGVSNDAGCGPFRADVHLGAEGHGLARPRPALGAIERWNVLEAGPAGTAFDLFGAAGVLADAQGGIVRLGFVLPGVPEYCSAGGGPPAAESGLLAHFFLLVAPGSRAESADLRSALAADAILPGARPASWVPAARLVPGGRSPGPPPPAPAKASARPVLVLAYDGGEPVLRCIAERVRAALWTAGRDVQLNGPGGDEPPESGSGGTPDLTLVMGLTRKRPEAWDHLRLLLALAGEDRREELLQAAEKEGALPGGDPFDEEWRIAAALERRLSAEGSIVPLLVAPVSWWLEAPGWPVELLDGVLPVWGEPLRPFVIARSDAAAQRDAEP